jgi:ADP-ribosyl-[dinitrogen reductase] hydrolase
MEGAAPPPIPNSYWVIPGKLLAGEHPGGHSPQETQERLQRLLDAGISCFVDLTMPDELEPYDTELPLEVDYIRKPIRDHGVPARREHMMEILQCVERALQTNRAVYVHCRAGIGRTGTVIGCLLASRGFEGEAALDELNRLWQSCSRARDWACVPETEQQMQYVRSWSPVVAEEADPLLDKQVLSAARSLRDRFVGAFIGLAVGDALAAATQYRRAGTFLPVGDIVGGGPFDVPRGGWTDDTAMALCLAESLLECDSFNPRDQVERYTAWQQQGHLSATGQCVGITANTARALSMAQWRRQLFSGSHDPKQLDPEVLSRVAPVVMFCFNDTQDALKLASDAARTTCQAPLALEACRVLAAMVHSALSGKPKERVLVPDPDILRMDDLRSEVAGILQKRGGEHSVRSSGTTVIEALDAAVWAFRTTSTFREGALRAANLGGNSDVVTAVYGQLAGAHYGVNAIPQAWRNSLVRKDLIEGFADRLLARAMLSLGGA